MTGLTIARRGRRAAAALAVVSGTACHDTPTAANEASCQPRPPTPTVGCGDISGLVVGLRGQPLAGVSLIARGPDTSSPFQSFYASTNADGAFRVRLLVDGSMASGKSVPDTASAYLVAANTPRDWAFGQPRVVDSTLTLIRLSPNGAVPEPSTVTVRLAVP